MTAPKDQEKTPEPVQDRPKLPKGLFWRDTSPFIWCHYSYRGHVYRESTETDKVKRALEIRETKKAELRMGRRQDPKSALLVELYRDVYDDYRINGRKSIDDIEDRWLMHLDPFFGRLAARDVTTTMIRSYILDRQAKKAKDGRRLVADATINRSLALLKRMYSLAASSTPPKVQSRPFIPMLRERNVRTGFLDDAQYDRLREGCEKAGPWMLAIFEIGANCGWRHGSILKMKVSQVDLATCIARLEGDTTKNEKGVQVELTPEICGLLEPLMAGKHPNDRIFTRPNGVPVRDFRGTWARLTTEAGVPDLRFHDLRRTAVRNLRRAGISEKAAMSIGGWLTPSTFHRYSIINSDETGKALRLVNENRKRQREASAMESENAQQIAQRLHTEAKKAPATGTAGAKPIRSKILKMKD